MALLAAFIGIDRYSDPDISDLSGAKRDATALWALFCDTIDGISASLLVDSDATGDNVRNALDKTLGAAGPADTVIVSFAGHGTHAHQLVLHDSKFNALDTTTIPMADLAERFRQSKAGIIIFILDCCFSGGAPARVLEGSPIPRQSGVTLSSIVGKGRVLIAASNLSEVAYEDPVTRHGLLTQAFLEAMQVEGPTVSIVTAMDRIMDRVRADAAKMGLVQTPVLVNHVEGALVLPVLRAGERFFKLFPERRGVKVGRGIEELAAFGFPSSILSEWSSQFPNGLNDLQLAAVNDYRILDGESLLVVAPTSAGKTFLGEMAACRAMLDGRKTVFLFPYRALVNEKFDQFVRTYGSLGMRVVRCTGDYSDQAGLIIRGKYDLAVLTYEMFLNLSVSNPAMPSQLGLVVLDEAQFITNQSRGISVELLLTNLIAARARGVAPQIIALSAVIGAVNDFDRWLGCKCLITKSRPIPLVEGVLDRTGTFQFLDQNGQQQQIRLLPPGQIIQRKKTEEKQDVIVPLVKKLISEGEQVIVFRNKRGSAKGCAEYLAAELGLPPATKPLNELPVHDLSSTSASLRKCLHGGTAFHNTNLTRDERQIVERGFRDATSGIRVLAATTIVAAGINTPATTAILAEQEFVGEDETPFTIAEYKNMAGRAGRLGYKELGTAIILADTPQARSELFRRYVLGKPEPIKSSFDPQRLSTWVVRLFAQIHRVPRAEVVRLLTNTYGGFLAAAADPSWRDRMARELETLVRKMIRLELLEDEGGMLQLSLLGRACGRSSLSFDSAMRLVESLKTLGAEWLTPERLMCVLQALTEADESYTPMMKKGESEAVRQREAVERFGQDAVRILQRQVPSHIAYYARCKRAAILFDWINGVAVESIEKRYSPNPFVSVGYGDIRRFADNTRFHLRSAFQIANVLFMGQGSTEDAIEALLNRLEFGLAAEALALLSLPIELTRGECLALHQAGAATPAQVESMSSESLESVLGNLRAKTLLTYRENNAKQRPTGDKPEEKNL